eukprot:scaffold503_cov365-Prasinococcus_capsulatus_cf.AAC.5
MMRSMITRQACFPRATRQPARSLGGGQIGRAPMHGTRHKKVRRGLVRWQTPGAFGRRSGRRSPLACAARRGACEPRQGRAREQQQQQQEGAKGKKDAHDAPRGGGRAGHRAREGGRGHRRRGCGGRGGGSGHAPQLRRRLLLA